MNGLSKRAVMLVLVSAGVLSAQNIQVSQGGLTFNVTAGGLASAPQTVTVTTGSGVQVVVTPSAFPSWIVVSPNAPATTPATFQISVNPQALGTSGLQFGNVTFSAPNNSPATVFITANVTGGGKAALAATPAALSFTSQVNVTPPLQTLELTTTIGTGVSFQVTATVNSGTTNWLTATVTNGNARSLIPGTVAVTVNPAGLAPGTYSGFLTFTPPGGGGGLLQVLVTYTVTGPQQLNISPPSLSFYYESGSTSPPAPQQLTLSSTGAPIPFVVSFSTATWFTATPIAGTTPATVSVQVSPAALAEGTYTGSITIYAADASVAPQAVPVSLLVSPNPLLSSTPAGLFFTMSGATLPAAQTLQLNTTRASATFTVSTSTGSGANWLSVTSPTTGSAPTTISVSLNANALSLPPGTYSGTITFTAPAVANNPFSVPVTLTVANAPALAAFPAGLTFNSQINQSVPSAQVLLISNAGPPITFTASTAITPPPPPGGTTWLNAITTSGTTPGNVLVIVNPTGLAAGQYTGTVVLTPAGTGGQLGVPVTLNVSSTALLNISPGALLFTFPPGGLQSSQQSLAITSTDPANQLNFAVAVSKNPGNSARSIGQTAGTTPATVTVTFSPTGFGPGTYNGSILVTAVGGGSQTVPVMVTVGGSTLSASPATLSFTQVAGGPAPQPQSVAVSSGITNVSFTALADSPWLSVAPASGSTPANLSVSVNGATLAAGTYTGTVTMTAPGASGGPQVVTVTLTVTNPNAAGNLSKILNAASYTGTAISPGEILYLGGTGIGPTAPASFSLTSSNTVPTTVGATQVLFDGLPAPVLYASSGQVNAIVPYEVAGKPSTSIQVAYQGTLSNAIVMQLAGAVPGIFTANASGTGPGAILNQNFSVNSPSNPAAKGSIVQIFGTGEGQTSPPGMTGSVNGSILRTPQQQPVTATVGGQPATVQYAGSAPGLIAGVFQVNVTIPPNAPSGNVPVVITFGASSTQAGVTVAVQ